MSLNWQEPPFETNLHMSLTYLKCIRLLRLSASEWKKGQNFISLQQDFLHLYILKLRRLRCLISFWSSLISEVDFALQRVRVLRFSFMNFVVDCRRSFRLDMLPASCGLWLPLCSPRSSMTKLMPVNNARPPGCSQLTLGCRPLKFPQSADRTTALLYDRTSQQERTEDYLRLNKRRVKSW